MKRSPLPPRRTQLRGRKKINPRSAKQTERVTAYADVREQVARRYWCEAAGLGVCQPDQHRGDHVHHRQTRGRLGGDTIDNLVLLCSAGHAWVHANPKRATELGLLVSGFNADG